MFTVLAQQGSVQLHLDTSNSARILRVSSTDPLGTLAIALNADDLPGIALKLLRSVPTTPYSDDLDGAKCCLVQYLNTREADANSQERRDALAEDIFADLPYDGLNVHAQDAINRIIELEDKLEAK